MSAFMPLLVLLFLGLMGWVLLRLIGDPGGPATFNPNSCCSRSKQQGGRESPESEGGREVPENRPELTRFRVASDRHRLHSSP